MLKRLYPFWRPARGMTACGMAALLAAAALELLQPWPVKWLVDHVLGSQPAPAWMQRSWPADRNSAILLVCGLIVTFAVGHKLAQMVSQLFLIRAGLTLVRELRCKVCDHLHRLSLRYHDTHKVGDSVYRALYDSFAAQSLLSSAIAPMVTGVVILIGVLVVMLRMDVQLTVIAIAVTPLFWFMIKLFGRLIEQRNSVYRDKESSLYAEVLETLSSIRAVKSFGREKSIADRFAHSANESARLNRRLSLVQVGFATAVGIAMALGTAAVVYIGSQRVAQGRMSIGDVLVFLAYMGMLYTPINSFTQGASVMRAAAAQLAKVFELLDTVPEIHDRAGVLTPQVARATGKIELRGVRFSYQPDQDVLHDLDAVVEPGTIVAVVGRTGSGKSTLASLIMRLYDPTGGAVLLDGHDLRDLPLAWLRPQVSFVMQDPMLLSGTIADNIGFGREGATRAEIEAAAEHAQATEFIRLLPNGFDTMLGERGVNLSGGQRQRLSIARGFLRNSPVLVLDEPTSALDGRTEEALVDSIEQLTRGRTTFIIAHRLSTVRIAHIIWVMENGRIVERGTHEELLSGETVYRRLYASQLTQNEQDTYEDVLT
jgi:ABC-type multidrug transport system fused ATPase/permease subunit